VNCKLTDDDKLTLELFNRKADEIINSSYVNESKTKDIGITLSWKKNQTPHGTWQYDAKHHDHDFIKSVILPLRLFIQNNERISVKNINDLYQNLPIDSQFKLTIQDIRQYLNDYLDERARTFFSDQPTRREILETFVYGELAHLNSEKLERLETWKKDDMEFQVGFFEFQNIIHEFIQMIKLIRNVNVLLLKRLSNDQ